MIVVVDPDQGPVTRRLRAQIGAAAHRRAVGLALGTVVPTTPAEQAIARPAQSKAMRRRLKQMATLALDLPTIAWPGRAAVTCCGLELTPQEERVNIRKYTCTVCGAEYALIVKTRGRR